MLDSYRHVKSWTKLLRETKRNIYLSPFAHPSREHRPSMQDGYIALPLDNLATHDFLQSVDRGAQRWFYERMCAKLEGETKEDWCRTTHSLFDLSTEEGRDNVFVHRHTLLVNDPVLRDAMKFVLQGDANMGLAAMHQSWTRTGFGKWAHILPGIGLRIAVDAKRSLSSMLGVPVTIHGVPHIIHKPPGGQELKSHTDGIPMKKLIPMLKAHVEGEDPSTMAWVRKFGLQCLVHLDGGGEDDGYTYVIAPMTPQKFLVCLRAVAEGRIVGAVSSMDKWMRGDETGPTFMEWRKCLPQFNRILQEHGLEPVKVCPISPSSSSTNTSSPFLACWAMHFPHGSSKNRKRRLSLTMPMQANGVPLSPEARCLKRLKNLARVAHCPTTRDQAETFLRSDTLPYYGGKTHTKPHLCAKWVRPEGPYHAIAPTLEDVDAFVEAATTTTAL